MAVSSTRPSAKGSSLKAGTTVTPRVLAPIGGILALAFVPIAVLFLAYLWHKPHYQFFPLVMIGSVVLFVSAIRSQGVRRSARLRWDRWLAVIPIGMLSVAIFLASPWLGMVAFLVLIACVLLTLGGWAFFRQGFPAWAFLWLMIPPPLGLDTRIIAVLQRITARWSSSVLDLLGVFHLQDGNVIEVAGRRFGVEEACSGIHSLLAVAACTIFFILWTHRRWWHALLLLGAAFGWVLVENVLRVVGVIYVSTRWNVDLTSGWLHDAFGFLLFFNTLFLVWSTDRLLLFLTLVVPHKDTVVPPAPVAASVAPGPATPNFDLVDLRRSWVSSRLVLGTLAVLGCAELLLLSAAASYDSAPLARKSETLSENALPAEIGPWKRAAFTTEQRAASHLLGEYSRIWTYQRGNEPIRAAISLDFAFPDFHDLAICYSGNGWFVAGRSDWPAGASDANPELTYYELNVNRPRQRKHGLVLFSACLLDGTLVERPPDFAWVGAALTDRVRKRFEVLQNTIIRNRPVPLQSGAIFQVQCFAERDRPFTPAEEKELHSLYLQCAGTLRSRFAALATNAPSEPAP